MLNFSWSCVSGQWLPWLNSSFFTCGPRMTACSYLNLSISHFNLAYLDLRKFTLFDKPLQTTAIYFSNFWQKKTRKNIAGWLACFSRLDFIVKSANQNAKCCIMASISLPSSKHFCRESLGSVSYAISRRSRCRPKNSCPFVRPSVLPSRSFSKTVHYFFSETLHLVRVSERKMFKELFW